MLRRPVTIVATGLAFLLTGGAAQAAMITFEFGGVVTSVQDPTGALGGGVNVNDEFSGTFTFDSETPDLLPGDPTAGDYRFANALMTLLVGQVAVTSNSSANHHIGVTNGMLSDGFSMGSSGFQTGTLWVSELYIYLNDPTTTAFDSDALPLTPPSLALFATRRFSFEGQGGVDVRGNVTVLTPEPGALAFVVLGARIMLRHKAKRIHVGTVGYASSSGRLTSESEGVMTC